MSYRKVFPFAAVVGQEAVKKALIWNVINPFIGGVLISGEKGTAKSTLVRGLAALLPGMKVIDLPINITEDRLVGSLDFEKAIKGGEKSFEPGIFYKADGNILYIDEVNLLPENIVNCILDVASSGVNRVEREGVSYTHSSRFVLVGSMNPEEGGLRPQFLDRFGLYVKVEGIKDEALRVEVIKRRLEYERDPQGFLKKWESKNKEIAGEILSARRLLKNVETEESIMKLACEISKRANCTGHRAEITIVETATAIAALCGRKYVNVEDVKEAAKYAIPHRAQERTPINTTTKDKETKEDESKSKGFEAVEEQNENFERDLDGNSNQTPGQDDYSEGESLENISYSYDYDNYDSYDNDEGHNVEYNGDFNKEKVEEPGEVFGVPEIEINPQGKKKRKGSGKRAAALSFSKIGRYVKYTLSKGKVHDIALDATIRAAAPFQKQRKKEGIKLVINKTDLREKIRERKIGSTILFIVDASGSMGANQRMKAVKGAVLSILNDVYQKRDKIGVVAFRKNNAELLLGITRSVDLAEKRLRELPTGGRTPLAAGLCKGYELIKAIILKDPLTIPFIILITDGRANVPLKGGDPIEEAIYFASKISAEGVKSLVIDTEKGYPKMGLGQKIAQSMGADYLKLEELEEGQIAAYVKNFVEYSVLNF